MEQTETTDSVSGAMEAVTELVDLSVFTANSGLTIGLFIGSLCATFAGARLLQYVFKRYLKKWAEGSESKLDDIIIMAFEKPLYYIGLAVGLQFSFHLLVLPQMVLDAITNGATVIVIVFVAWTINQLITAFKAVYVDPWTDASESKLDDQIVPILENTMKAAVWAFAFMMAFANMGYDLMSVITGLGIGGLALAMAAQDTLSNVFGSVTIFADRPFQVDDTVTLGGHTGVVEEVGLRTCRLRTFDGTIVTVPNSVLVGGVVENLSARTARKHVATFGLVYETTTEQLESAIAALKEIIGSNEHVRDDYSVRFTNFGDSALEITCIFWVDPPSEYWNVVHDVNLAIKSRFDKDGFDMAFPSTTVYSVAAAK